MVEGLDVSVHDHEDRQVDEPEDGEVEMKNRHQGHLANALAGLHLLQLSEQVDGRYD
jgi:hypothetical protein